MWLWRLGALEVSALPRVLLVDASRSARAAMGRELQAHFELREEEDGEAAWQALVLDPAIRGIVSATDLARVSGYQLLERVRASRVRRLQQMPFVLLADDEAAVVAQRSRPLGEVEVLARAAGKDELRIRLNRLMARTGDELPEEGPTRPVLDPVSGLYSRQYLELQSAQALSHAARHGVAVSVMVIAFDRYEALRTQLGISLETVVQRFASLLSSKVRREDSLGSFAEGQFAIVSPGISQAAALAFAERILLSVMQARLSLGGQTLALTASIGVASVPEDAVRSAGDFLRLAGERMLNAAAAGGNRLQASGAERASLRMNLDHALDLLANGRGAAVRPHLGSLGRQCLPLLQLLDDELGLALPLAEIERRLNERERK